jgi:CDP-glucose 4,6-dehydratase
LEEPANTLESMELTRSFWNNKNVLVTGHTGFKGSWLTLALKELGANVSGFSVDVPSDRGLFNLLNMNSLLQNDIREDIQNISAIQEAIKQTRPQIVFHLAAQPLVRRSYEDPHLTYNTNVMGTLNVLMSCLHSIELKTVINITTDKCYENNESSQYFKESDPLGGKDPYSSSKACSEILTTSLRESFYRKKNISLITARAGNVIGGGDWSEDRIIPDFVRALENKTPLNLRNPESIRPWQHVLESIWGYLLFAEEKTKNKIEVESLNFGPNQDDILKVKDVVGKLNESFENKVSIKHDLSLHVEEARHLKLDSILAKKHLGWNPEYKSQEAIRITADWYKCLLEQGDIYLLTQNQVRNFFQNKIK